MIRHGVGPADRAEENRIRGSDPLLPIIRHHFAVADIMIAAREIVPLLDDRKAVQRRRPLENADAFRNDLLTDAVTGNDGDAIGPIVGFRSSHLIESSDSIAQRRANDAVHLLVPLMAADIVQQHKTGGLAVKPIVWFGPIAVAEPAPSPAGRSRRP